MKKRVEGKKHDCVREGISWKKGLISFFGVLVVILAVGLGYLQMMPRAMLDRDALRNMKGGETYPLHGKIAVVTGSTSGIGKAIATELVGFGATVYVVGRSSKKMKDTAGEIMGNVAPDCPGSVRTASLDTSDLTSVASFTSSLLGQLEEEGRHLDILVNNAGIHHASNPDIAKLPSPQGFDMAFSTNYLGHFLLTDSLLPHMGTDGRIVQIASSMHFGSHGEDLRVKLNSDGSMQAGSIPDAANANINSFYHEYAAYGNNKLAQVMHAISLQKRLNSGEEQAASGVKIVAVCPNWVGTPFLPDDIGGRFVSAHAFSPSAGTSSALFGIFSSEIQGGEYVSNSNLIGKHEHGFLLYMLRFFGKINVRITATFSLSMVLLALQNSLYGAKICYPSLEARDESLSEGLYLWSKGAVKQFRI